MGADEEAGAGDGHTPRPFAHLVDRRGDLYSLVCGCGWRSPDSPLAGEVGEAWDAHLERHHQR